MTICSGIVIVLPTIYRLSCIFLRDKEVEGRTQELQHDSHAGEVHGDAAADGRQPLHSQPHVVQADCCQVPFLLWLPAQHCAEFQTAMQVYICKNMLMRKGTS